MLRHQEVLDFLLLCELCCLMSCPYLLDSAPARSVSSVVVKLVRQFHHICHGQMSLPPHRLEFVITKHMQHSFSKNEASSFGCFLIDFCS
ncbi:hypothetical protein HDV57DRAFT_480960 [Trichoderma longibrachiatum]